MSIKWIAAWVHDDDLSNSSTMPEVKTVRSMSTVYNTKHSLRWSCNSGAKHVRAKARYPGTASTREYDVDDERSLLLSVFLLLF